MSETQIAKVGDVMTKEVLSVGPEESLDVVAQLFERYDYDGIPVIGGNRAVLGIVTAYDMILQSSGMHLPTVLNIMERIAINRADRSALEEHFSKLKEIKTKQIMNPQPLTVAPDMSITDAARIFAEHHRVNPLIVINQSNILVGVLSRYDIIKFFNEKYFRQVVERVTSYRDPFKEFKTKSERDIESAVGEISQEFLLVTKKRPLIWKYVAIGMFIAGLIAATALIIRIVRQEGTSYRRIIHMAHVGTAEDMVQ